MKILNINFSKKWQQFENHHNQFTDLLSKRFKLVISEDPDFYFFTHSFCEQPESKDYLKYKCHRIFFGYENVRADWNICDYVLDSDFYNNNPASFPIVLLNKVFFFYREHDGQEIKNKYSYVCYGYKYLHDALQISGFPLNEEQKNYLLKKAKRSFVKTFLKY